MTNTSVLSLGLFGRLSAASASRQKVLDYISQNRKCRILMYGYNESSATAEEILASSFPLLLVELNGLIESIVLADTIIEFQGYDPAYVNKLQRTGIDSQTGCSPMSWYYTAIWPDEANRLRQKTLDRVNVEITLNNNPGIFDAELALQVPEDAGSFSILKPMLAKGEVDFSFFHQWGYDWTFESDEREEEGWKELKKYVDRKLGSDWVAYRSAVDITELWPSGLARLSFPFLPKGIAQEYLHWQFKLGLYAEFCEAMTKSTVSVSGFSSGNYYRLLAGRDNVSAYLRKVISRNYAAVLRSKLEEAGYLCLDLEMPPILRLCLNGSTTIEDVIDRAIELRKHRWFIKLRGYLFELAMAEHPEKLIRHLKRLQEHIEASIAGIGASVTTGLGVSSTGSMSISLPTIGKKLLSWLNPVVYVHSRISKVLGNQDSISDLGRIFNLNRSEVLTMLRKIDLLNDSHQKVEP